MRTCGRFSPLTAALLTCSVRHASALSFAGRLRSSKHFLGFVDSFGFYARVAHPKGVKGTAVRGFLDRRAGFPPSLSVVALFSADSDCTQDSRMENGRGLSHSNRIAGDLRVLGVCGGIGSGKSLACRILVSELGCAAHIDADKLSHGVYTPGSSALKGISEEFGSDILQENGEIDRKRLGNIVFSDANAMSKLEGIVWPHARALLESRLREIATEIKRSRTSSSTPFVVVEAAVLIDAGWDDLFDAVWVLKAPQTTTADRLVSDRGMDGQDASMRIEAQQSRRGIGNLEEEMERGTVTAVIENNGSIDDLTESLAKRLSDPSSWKDHIAIETSKQ